MALTNLEKAKRGRAKNRAFVDGVKLGRGCLKCGFKGDVQLLHFHHRDPSTKFDKISNMLTYSRKRIIAEIEKCDVLCDDCHIVEHSGIKPWGVG